METAQAPMPDLDIPSQVESSSRSQNSAGPVDPVPATMQTDKEAEDPTAEQGTFKSLVQGLL